MTIATDGWFTETFPHKGAAFSVAINKKLAEVTSPYQTIAIYDTQHMGHMMVIDDCIMLTQLDNYIYHEMMAHPILFSHPDPKDVLIVGGGDCGTLREVAKHKGVAKIIQVDIDEKVTELAQTYFPELCQANDDPRAQLCFEDAVKWIQSAQTDSLDIIIIDSTDPIGPGEGLFTESFYRQCHRTLRPQGRLVHQSESPLLHPDLMVKIRQNMLNAGLPVFIGTSLF